MGNKQQQWKLDKRNWGEKTVGQMHWNPSKAINEAQLFKHSCKKFADL